MICNKVVPVEVAIADIRDGSSVSVCGAWMNVPDSTLKAIEEQYLGSGYPRDLTLIFPICPGGVSGQLGIDHLAHEGLVCCVIGGSYPNAESPLRKLISNNQVTAYNLPSGMITAWLREIGAGRPGVLSRKGLGTFVDPRQTGGRMNAATTEQILVIASINKQEYLFLPARPIDVALIRGTTADEAGNLTFEQESATLTAFAQAAATRASGGTVIAQVKRVVERGSLNPHQVKVPGTLVDYVVVDAMQKQTVGGEDDAALSGEIRKPYPSPSFGKDVELMIARRAAQEVRKGDVVVIGFGISAYVPQHLLQERRLTDVTFMIEQGPIGGLPLTDLGFGNSVNPEVIIDAVTQFDLLGGGCFDVGMLSFMQVDPQCRVNVHLLNSRPNLSVGIGGFLDIVNSAKRLLFLGYFTAGGLKVEMQEKNVRILQEGKSRKFVRQVDNVSFDPSYGKAGEILFITERAVLRWAEGNFELIEVAPGIDVDKDVLGQMEFAPRVSTSLKRGSEL